MFALMGPKFGFEYGNEFGSPAGASEHNQAESLMTILPIPVLRQLGTHFIAGLHSGKKCGI